MAQDSAENAPPTETPTAPQGIPEQSESSDNEDKRKSDTLEAAQRKFTEASERLKEVDRQSVMLEQMIEQQKRLAPQPEALKPYKVDLGEDFSDSLIDDPAKARQAIQDQFDNLNKYHEGNYGKLLNRMEEISIHSSVTDDAVRTELAEVKKDFPDLYPEEQLRMAQKLAGKVVPRNENQEPVGGLESGKRPERPKAEEKLSYDPKLHDLSGANNANTDKTKAWA